MTEQLYIDNKPVDIPSAGLGITLNYASNILDGIAKHKSNYTNTVKLPKTQRNAEVFDCPAQVSVVSMVPYRYHSCRYVRDGVEIIKDGRCYLLKVSTAYEVSLIWGGDAITSIIDSGALLSDLTGNEQWEVIAYPENFIGTTAPDYGNIWYNGREGYSQLKPAAALADLPYNPSVAVAFILARIGTQYNINFDTTNISQRIADLYCLITGKKGTDTTFQGESMNCGFSGGNSEIMAIDSGGSWTNVFAVETSDNVRCTKALGNWGVNIIGSAVFKSSTALTQTQMDAVQVWTCDARGDLKNQVAQGVAFVGVTGQYVVGINADFDAKKDDAFCFRFVTPTGVSITDTGGSINLTIPRAPEEVPFSTTNKTRYAPVFANLPEVKIVDFLATINAICGTYLVITPKPSPQTGWDATFIPFVVNNATNVQDWSARLISSKADALTSEIAYTHSEWARHNLLQWSGDEVGGDIPVDNDTLKETRTWYQSPFKIPAGSDGYTIPTYKVEDDGTFEYAKPAAHLLKAVRWNPFGTQVAEAFYIATNNGLDFAAIVSSRYVAFKEWLLHPKFVKVEVRLTDVELASLAEYPTIYLAQFGCLFLPITIQVGKNQIAKCELLKIS